MLEIPSDTKYRLYTFYENEIMREKLIEEINHENEVEKYDKLRKEREHIIMINNMDDLGVNYFVIPIL